MSLDIHSAVWTASLLLGLFALLLWIQGIRSWRAARRLTFFRLRRDRMRQSMGLLLAGLLLALCGIVLNRRGETVLYRYFSPSPTPTLSPTPTPPQQATSTPILSPSPTLGPSPMATLPPTVALTPIIPTEIWAQFTGVLTPPPAPRFSPIVFTTALNFNTYTPLNPGEVFRNPIPAMYGVFSYDGMLPGVQWTALWYRNGELVHYETKPWDGGTGGYGYTEWHPPAEAWLPGTYTVYIFVGDRLVQRGSFVVEGHPPTSTPTATPTLTPTSTPTATPTPTPSPTRTPFLGPTPTPRR